MHSLYLIFDNNGVFFCFGPLFNSAFVFPRKQMLAYCHYSVQQAAYLFIALKLSKNEFEHLIGTISNKWNYNFCVRFSPIFPASPSNPSNSENLQWHFIVQYFVFSQHLLHRNVSFSGYRIPISKIIKCNLNIFLHPNKSLFFYFVFDSDWRRASSLTAHKIKRQAWRTKQ